MLMVLIEIIKYPFKDKLKIVFTTNNMPTILYKYIIYNK